jgi:hypothetical protein
MDSKEAIKAGFKYLMDLFPNDSDVRLEEVEKDAEKDNWLITFSLSGIPEKTMLSNLQLAGVLLPNNAKRRFKILTIESATGEVISMKIRELHDVS